MCSLLLQTPAVLSGHTFGNTHLQKHPAKRLGAEGDLCVLWIQREKLYALHFSDMEVVYSSWVLFRAVTSTYPNPRMHSQHFVTLTHMNATNSGMISARRQISRCNPFKLSFRG